MLACVGDHLVQHPFGQLEVASQCRASTFSSIYVNRNNIVYMHVYECVAEDQRVRDLFATAPVEADEDPVYVVAAIRVWIQSELGLHYYDRSG